MTELPEPAENGGGFGGEAHEAGEVARREVADGVVIETDDADDLAVVLHRRGDFAGGGRADAHVAGIAGDIGHELRAGVESDPAGDALAEAEDDLAVIGGQPELGFDFEATGVGVQQGDGTGRGGEVCEEFAEDARKDGRGIVALKTQRGDAAERRLVGQREGVGGGRSAGRIHGGDDWGFGADGQKF